MYVCMYVEGMLNAEAYSILSRRTFHQGDVCPIYEHIHQLHNMSAIQYVLPRSIFNQGDICPT